MTKQSQVQFARYYKVKCNYNYKVKCKQNARSSHTYFRKIMKQQVPGQDCNI